MADISLAATQAADLIDTFIQHGSDWLECDKMTSLSTRRYAIAQEELGRVLSVEEHDKYAEQIMHWDGK